MHEVDQDVVVMYILVNFFFKVIRVYEGFEGFLVFLRVLSLLRVLKVFVWFLHSYLKK